MIILKLVAGLIQKVFGDGRNAQRENQNESARQSLLWVWGFHFWTMLQKCWEIFDAEGIVEDFDCSSVGSVLSRTSQSQHHFADTQSSSPFSNKNVPPNPGQDEHEAC